MDSLTLGVLEYYQARGLVMPTTDEAWWAIRCRACAPGRNTRARMRSVRIPCAQSASACGASAQAQAQNVTHVMSFV